MSKRPRSEPGSRLATSGRDVEVVFSRNGRQCTGKVSYPSVAPDDESDLLLASAAQLLCPGCSDQEVALGRCHGSILARHVASKNPGRPPPQVRGLQGVFKPSDMVALLDDERSVFVGRRAPRGVPTKKIGVQTTLHRSKYANPFVVAKKGFALGESLELFRAWVENGFRDVPDEALQEAVSRAPRLPESVEEIVRSHPELFV